MNHERLYSYRFREVDQGARVAVWGPIARYVQRDLGNPRRVLDPAAGRGEFINAVEAEERWAVDRVAHEGGGPDPGTRFLLGDAMTADLPEGHFDGVFVSNFLEHLPSQEAVAAFLERMRALMRAGGRIAVMGPNIRYCQKQYWDFADHIVPLTDRSVEEHLYAAGFEPLKTIPRFLPYSFTGRLPASPRLTSAYLRLPLLWSLLGRQFLVVDRN
jgi:Methyltransferase domain